MFIDRQNKMHTGAILCDIPTFISLTSGNLTAEQETIQTTNILQDSDPLTSYASYLRELYTSMSTSRTSQRWAHLPRCEFIQLAMIGSGELRRGDREEEMVRLAQLGRIETIMSHKQSIDLNNLFLPPVPQIQPLVVLPPPPPHPRVLLIEGAPGGGKSTLALHICHQWAQYASHIDRFDIVVLAYLRDQAIQNATTLADILPARTLKMSQTVASQLQSSGGSSVLFIFDGWDEFPSHLQSNSLVSTIIKQPFELSLHHSTVLITSRPVSSGNLLHIADLRVEILGFTQHQIREYIKKALDGNSIHIQKLVQHLEEHPVIEGYCYVPLHVAILVHIFLTMKGALPITLHELFCDLVLCCIVRELDTHESESDTSEVCSLDDLPDDLKSKLSDLCVLAHEGVVQNKVVFYRDDLRKFNLPANLPSLGLLQAVEGLTLFRKSLSYNFLHLSVQELLAAYHISHIDSSKQIEVFKQMFVSSRFQAVLHYYSGFTKLVNPAIQDFVSSYTRQKSSIEDLLPLLHCFYEAQEPSLCKLLFTRELELNSVLSPVDYLAIGYFVTSLLSVPSSDMSNILLKIRKIGDKHRLNLLLLELSKYPIGEANERRLEITVLMENMNIFSHQIFEGLQHNSALVHLNLSNTGLVATESTAQALTTMLQVNKTLRYLDLSNNWNFSDSGAYCVFQSLQHNTTLVHLNHSNTGLVATEDTAQALTTMLQVNKTLTHLDLSGNLSFSDSGAYYVFQSLQNNTSLVHLNLSNVDLKGKDDSAQALSTMLQVNKTLTHLNLSGNLSFSDSGAYYVFQSLQNNTSLVHLNLSKISLEGKEDTAQALTTMLQVNKTLTQLDLSSNKFSPHCVLQGLQNNTSLVHLNLRNIYLKGKDDSTQWALTKMLQVNKTPIHLNLSGNRYFSDSGAYYFFQCLQDNTSLVHLILSNTDLKGENDSVQALSTMLQVNKTLTHLDLSLNWKFLNSGAYYVFQSLQHNTTLAHLNLSNTGLVATEDTVQALTTMLQVNKTLTHLDLSVNLDFSDAGAYCVCQGLQHNTSLVHLNLRSTGMTKRGAEYIAQALESNCSLQTLNVSNNYTYFFENSLERNITVRLIA